MTTRSQLVAALGLAALAAPLPLGAADWPQWNGPQRDNISRETGLLKEWPEGGPKLLWTYKDAGAGYSSPAIVGDRLYLTGARGDSEFLFALDLKASPPNEVWAVKLGPTFSWKGNSWNVGPSAAPAVEGGLVYALGGLGDLVCAEADGGKEVWRTSLARDLGGEVNPIGGGPEKLGWGFTAAPLVDGDVVVVVPGGPQGMAAALDKKTGKVAWRGKGLTGQATYAAPLAADLGGVRQYLIMTYGGVAGVAAKDGSLLWNYKREEPFGDIVAVAPAVDGNLVFITGAGGGAGGADLIKVMGDGGQFRAERVFSTRDLAVYHGGVVLLNGHVYGASGEGARTKWVCLDLKAGKPAWERDDRRLGKGSLTCADSRLYLLGEKGQVLLAEASPTKWVPRGQFKLPEETALREKLGLSRGGFWTHPVVANGRLYLRDQDLLYCYDVKGQ